MDLNSLERTASVNPGSTPRGGGSKDLRRKLVALKDVLEELRRLNQTLEQQRKEAGKTVRLDGRPGGEALVKTLDRVTARYQNVLSQLQQQGDARKSMLEAVQQVGETLSQSNLGLEVNTRGLLTRPQTDQVMFDANAREPWTKRHRPQSEKNGPPSGDPPRFDSYQ